MGNMMGKYVVDEVLRQKGILVFAESLPTSKSDFSMSTIAHPDVIKQLDEFLVKDKDLVAQLKAKYKIVE